MKNDGEDRRALIKNKRVVDYIKLKLLRIARLARLANLKKYKESGTAGVYKLYVKL